MAKQKEVTLEFAYEAFEKLSLKEQINLSKLISSSLEGKATIAKNEIAMLSEVVSTNQIQSA